METEVRRLGPGDAAEYRRLRLEGFERHPLQFRYSPADEAATSLADAEARLAASYVVGACAGGELGGIGGFTRLAGEKLRHTGLLWGMYVRAEARGAGLADAIVSAVVEHAAREVEILQLTVMADNPRAIRLYERWGFRAYATEPAAVKVGDAYLDELLMMKRLR